MDTVTTQPGGNDSKFMTIKPTAINHDCPPGLESLHVLNSIRLTLLAP